MLDPLDTRNRPFLDALSRKRRAAFLTLTVEKISLHGWRLFFWILFFMGLWMLEVPQFFGMIGKAAAALVFFGGIIFWFRKDVASCHLPNKAHIDQRLETDSSVLAGSITALDDRLANPKKHSTRELWDMAQKQILGSLWGLRVSSPRAILVRKDPYALRFIAVLLFLSGLLLSGTEWSARIWSGMIPLSPKFDISEGKSIDIWIKPPQYTGQASLHLTGDNATKEALKIPQGSEVKLRVYSPLGKFLAPVFMNGASRQKMKYVGEGLYSFDGVVIEGTSLSVYQALIPRAVWHYAFIKDSPPSIKLDTPEEKEEEPVSLKEFEILPNSQLRFTLSVRDDYSVKDLGMEMVLDPVAEDFPLGEPAADNRLVMSPPETDFKISPVYDMTWHTWAGLPVIFNFTAKDHPGQIAKLAPIKVVLPERPFENPVAKSLITVRKKLAWSKDHDFTALANDLAGLLKAKDFFNNNPVVYLAIKTASARLVQSEVMRDEDKIVTSKAVIDLLWDTAIALEDGALALALRDLKDAQKELEQAMRDPNMPDEKIAQLMENLQEKIQSYFAELQKEMQKRIANGEQFPMISPDQFGQMISPDSLQSFLEQLQSELESGDKNKAQEMLSQLQRMMDMMDPSMNAPIPPDMQMMSEGVNELQELIDRQEKLLDQTKDQAELQSLLGTITKHNSDIIPAPSDFMKKFGLDGFPPAPKQKELDAKEKNGVLSTGKNKAEQEALRYILGQLMMDAGEQLEEIPENMGKAEQDMRGSEKTLGDNDPKSAVPHQESALENLKQAQDELSQKLQKRMQQMVGVGLSGGMRYDPLGRPYGGKGQKNGQKGEQDVKIPDEAQKKRVEEILRLLRDRSGEFQRPQEELEYYRRLLRQF